MKKKYIIDIEANGLLDTVDTIWMIVCKPLGEEEFRVFTDNDENYEPLSNFKDFIDNSVEAIIWHNGIRYDAEAIRQVLDIDLSHIKQYDTVIMSRVLKYTRFKQGPAYTHSLKAWGIHLGEHKGDFNEWDKYSQEMLDYCKQDTRVNELIYNKLLAEVKAQSTTKPLIKEALRVEHELSKLSAQQVRDGWLFNFDECRKLINKISTDMEEIETAVEPHLSDREIIIDVEPKKPIYKKDGTYTAVSARVISDYLGYIVVPEDALKANPPISAGTEFQRKKLEPASMGNQDIVKEYLDSIGWKPDEWNWQRLPTGQFIKKSAKLTSKSLNAMSHPHGRMIDEYYTLRARKSVMTGWMEQLEGDGRLKGDVMDMGAQSFRQTHKIIANLPSGKAKYGKEIRELFIAPQGKTIISADGAAYQIRLLAHYLNDKEYTKTVLDGDPHQLNADSMNTSRDLAKPTFFAVLYGAGAAKVGNILGVTQREGKEKRQALIDGIPNLRSLIEKAERVTTRQGYMSGLDGRRVYSESPYKSLNYLIQSAEAILMKRTIVSIAEEFRRENIEFKQLLFYHDEVSYEINPEDTQRATEIISKCFSEAPKHYGVNIMEAGDIKVGQNYFEVH